MSNLTEVTVGFFQLSAAFALIRAQHQRSAVFDDLNVLFTYGEVPSGNFIHQKFLLVLSVLLDDQPKVLDLALCRLICGTIVVPYLHLPWLVLWLNLEWRRGWLGLLQGLLLLKVRHVLDLHLLRHIDQGLTYFVKINIFQTPRFW